MMKNLKEKLRKHSHLPLQQKEYLGINLPKETKDLYAANYKALMKEKLKMIQTDEEIYHAPGLEESTL